VKNLNLSNQAVNYMPDYCPIGDALAVTMSVITDTDSVVTDKMTAFFSTYGKQFSQTQVTASGNTIICTANEGVRIPININL
jgi:hypothetical protein